ncbi:hypothetical protein QTP70_024322 [Hemibagrus guttatus]|uniref:Uncharacterized protein n=1 Tax=Hemibagrus guttatus TaxID=175788 RepID=A0AAE0PXH9_9TELE|nr:hypothetical protein QTP70_024322 [Hemibagrus guttatus]
MGPGASRNREGLQQPLRELATVCGLSLIRRSKPALKLVKSCPAGAISALQYCFECTDWDMFREAATNGNTTNLEEYTSSVTSYISKCIDDVTISKSITTRSNQKPWITAKVTSYISKCIDDMTISKSITTHSNQKPWMTAKLYAELTHGKLLDQTAFLADCSGNVQNS